MLKDSRVRRKKDKATILWMIPIEHHRKVKLFAQNLPSVPLICYAANSAYYHQPTTAKTLCNAINNDWLTSFPVLTSNAVQNPLPKAISTTMGHIMPMIKKDIQSTNKPATN